jgi:hypothetical protein
VSKYGLSRTLRVFLDLVTVKFLSLYSTRPIHIFGLAGLLSTGAGVAITGWLGFERLFLGTPLAGRPLVLLGILLTVMGMHSSPWGCSVSCWCAPTTSRRASGVPRRDGIGRRQSRCGANKFDVGAGAIAAPQRATRPRGRPAPRLEPRNLRPQARRHCPLHRAL